MSRRTNAHKTHRRAARAKGTPTARRGTPLPYEPITDPPQETIDWPEGMEVAHGETHEETKGIADAPEGTPSAPQPEKIYPLRRTKAPPK